MTRPDRSTPWNRLRQFVRRALGRTKLDEIQRELSGWREIRSREEQQAQRDHVAIVQAAVQGMEERLVSHVVTRIDEQWRSFEERRGPLLALIDQLRTAVEDCVGATARIDAMMLRSIQMGQEIEGEVQRRGTGTADAVGALRETIADAVQRLEERHREWLAAQGVTQTAMTDLHAAIDGRWSQGFAALEKNAEHGERMQREIEEARDRERTLADQTAHLIEVLGHTRRELASVRERAEQTDEALAARHDLQRELDRAKEDLEAAAAELEEVREAHGAFHRWKESSDAEIARLARERDRLLLESLRAAESVRGAEDPSFGAADR